MKIVLVSPSKKHLQEIGTALHDWGYETVCVEGGKSQLREVVERERPDLLLTDGMCCDVADLSHVEFVTNKFPRTAVLLMCSSQSHDYLLHAMRAGVREVLPSPVGLDALKEAVQRVAAKMTMVAGPRQAQVLAFLPCKGGSGATFLATNVAWVLAQSSNVLLIDLNLQFGDALSFVHDGRPASTITDLAANVGRLDPSLLAACAVKVLPRLSVLAAPDDPGQALEIQPQHVEAIISAAATQYDYIILDMGLSLDTLTIKALDRANRIYAVLQPMLPAIRHASKLQQAFSSLGYPTEKLQWIVNRYERTSEIDLEHIQRSLRTKDIVTLADAYKDVNTSINHGEPLVSSAKTTVLARQITELATAIQPRREDRGSGELDMMTTIAQAQTREPGGLSLRERLNTLTVEAAARSPAQAAPVDAYKALKTQIHLKLLDTLDLAVLETLTPEKLRHEIAVLVERLLQEEQAAVNDAERSTLIRDIQHEMLGFGPLELLMADPLVSDILVNSWQQIYVERRGKLELTDVTFTDEKHLLRIIDKIVSLVGRRIDESSPMVDARLPDGSRVNAVIPPVALDGPMMSIRRFAFVPLKMEDLVETLKTLTPDMAELLHGLVRAKVNILISGGTGAGKTTLLNILSGYIPESERVVTIEDAAELQMQQPHVVRMETRPPNIEGKGEITQRALVRNALRMRPDRIVIGEVRGAEAFDMLQAMNTGHEGSLATIHANTPRDALSRLENMIGMANLNLPHKAARQQIGSAIGVVIQVLRMIDGKRKVTSIQEVTGMEGDVITMQEIFTFRQAGVAEDGSVQGHFQATGVRPKFAERLRSFSIALPDSMFNPDRRYN
jgi:pilus assembly protein CpaF